MPAPALPQECIQLILDHFPDTGSLYSLLPVSKTWLPAVVERLYCDPLARINQCNNTPHALLLFLSRIVLRLSPSQDHIVAALRRVLESEPRPSADSLSFAIDYLSFIRVVRFTPRLICSLGHLRRARPNQGFFCYGEVVPLSGFIECGHDSPMDDVLLEEMPEKTPAERKVAVQHAINVAIAGHRFHEVQELQIPLAYLTPYYLQPLVVQSLKNLTCIVFDHGYLGGAARAPSETLMLSVLSFILDHESAHGVQQGQLEIVHVGNQLEIESLVAGIMDAAFAMLGSTYSPKHYINGEVKIESLRRLDQVRSIQLTYRISQTAVQALMDRLEECCSLKELRVTITYPSDENYIYSGGFGGEEEQCRIFEWAVKKRLTCPAAPLPPLRVVELFCYGRRANRLIDHLFDAFGPTLEDVQLYFRPPRAAPVVIGEGASAPWQCPRLKRLIIWSTGILMFQTDTLTGDFPCLHTLHLQDSANLLSPSPSRLLKPWERMPKLIHLFLEGRAATEFRLTSLQSMPSLTWLAIRCRPLSEVGYDMAEDVDIVSQWMLDMPNPWPETVAVTSDMDTCDRLESHWFLPQRTGSQKAAQQNSAATKPWHHPALKYMSIQGPPAMTMPAPPSSYLAIRFPHLEQLIIGTYPFLHYRRGEIDKEALSSMVSYQHLRLNTIIIHGEWPFRLSAMQSPLRNYPCLQRLVFQDASHSFASPLALVKAMEALDQPPPSSSPCDSLARPKRHIWTKDDISENDALASGLEEVGPSPPCPSSWYTGGGGDDDSDGIDSNEFLGETLYHFGDTTFRRRVC